MRYSILLLALLCAACGNYSANVPTLKPYKMDIQQGNVVTPKMMMQLRPGMTKSQVRFIMGTPLLTDSFHGDRWDYFYQMRKDGKIIEQRRVILEFEGDSLAHVRGDVIPAGTDPSAVEQPKSTAPRPVAKPATKKEPGLLDKLKFWGDDDESKKTAPKEQTKPAAEPVRPELIPETKPEPKPEPEMAPPPAPARSAEPVVEKKSSPKPAEQQEEKKGWLDKLKFWGDDEKPQPKPAPTPVAKPIEQPVKAEPRKPAPVAAEQPPAPRRSSLPETKPKAPPKPAADLPPEDAPQFFEKMLEKIGF